MLESPSSFYMPCLSKDPILEGKAQPHGAGFKWHEFQFTVFDFPGQTFYHDALLAHRDSGENILLVGDSFTPSGLDDYCLRNRNLLADERGYFNCLRQIRSLPRETFLINQHVAPMFRFAADQLDFMEQSLARRRQTLAELFPWPHPDFGLDDQWVRISPYESRARAGETIELQAVVLNHATEALPFELRPVPPTGWRSARESYKVTLPPGRETTVPFRLTPTVTAPGLAVVTADVRLGSTKLLQWTEALVTVI